MKRTRLLLLIVSIFYLVQTEAQITNNLRLDSNSLNGLPNTLHHGDTVDINITIYNDSSTSFIGFISVGSDINGNVDSNDSVLSGAIYYPNAGSLDTVPAHGSVLRALIVTGTTPPFIIGSSSVVIWPIAQNTNRVLISDSIGRTINFAYALGINEPEDKNLRVYMSGQQLIVQEDGGYLLKSIELYDVAGVLLHQQGVTQSGVINMNPYADGIYFAEVTFADNSRQVIKVFNTR